METLTNTKTKTPCQKCGKYHLTPNHFLEDFPNNPIDLVDDYLKMGLYNSDTLSLAEKLVQKEIKHTLTSNPKIQTNSEAKVIEELIKEAGGLDTAIAVAFGDRSSEFFHNILKKPFNRRKFLQQVLLGAALVSLTNCGNNPEEETELKETSLEKTDLKIAFLPITCATPIIMSKPLGFYEKYGLNVELVKMTSWTKVRDSAIAGELDAYHMLSPMPLAMTLGLGSRAFPIKLASIENINGNAITVAMKHKNKVSRARDFKGFRIAIPFVYSMHNLLLRYYLAAGGIDPDKDVELVTLPPARMIEGLKNGTVDAMIVAEPFNQLAVDKKIGFIHILTQEIWPGHPCCSFTASQKWIEEHPSTFRAVNKAIIEGAEYASKSRNRKQIAREIAPNQYVNASRRILEEILTGNFEDGLGNSLKIPDRIDFDPYPWKSFSYWITSQFVRWNLIPNKNIEHEEIADKVFMTGLARQLAKQLNQTPPSLILRYENLKYGRFDPSEPENYVKKQIRQKGF